jgi:DNA-binding response OmpR family regulator
LRIAVLEDDPEQSARAIQILRDAGHDVYHYPDGDAIVRALRRETFDLVMLDWMVPKRSGIEVVRWARANIDSALPILLVTSRGDSDDIVAGLEAGADDYVVKPFDAKVLVARITAALRRAYPAEDAPPIVEIAGFRFDSTTDTVTTPDGPVTLTAKEFALSLLLFQNMSRALSRAYVLERVWGRNPDLPTRTLDAHVSRVRVKLNLRPEAGFRLVPVYSYGYRLEIVDGTAPSPSIGTALAVALGALLLAASPDAARAQADAAAASYVIQQGDTLYNIADRYMTGPQAISAVQALNDIPTPTRLQPGSTLRIPLGLLSGTPVTAKITAFSGDVTIRTAKGTTKASAALAIPEGAVVTTGLNSFVTIEALDGSKLTFPSQSSARIERLRRVLLTGAIERSIRIETGRVEAQAAKARQRDDRFTIRTPTAVASVRGTQFRVSTDPAAARSTVEVVEGQVVAAKAGERRDIALDAGFGSTVTPAGISPPIRLLPAPVLAARGIQQGGPQTAFEFVPVDGAVRYTVRVARDAALSDTLAELDTAEPVATFPPFPAGNYFVSAAATDANGLRGLPSVATFSRSDIATELNPTKAVLVGRSLRYVFTWNVTGSDSLTYRFRLGTTPELDKTLVDRKNLPNPRYVLSGLLPGKYYWQVAAVQTAGAQESETWSLIRPLEIEN